jgi:hypothetical protein
MTYEGLRIKYPVCAMAIHACGTKGSISCIAALYICQTIVVRILAEADNINVRDVASCAFSIAIIWRFIRICPFDMWSLGW